MGGAAGALEVAADGEADGEGLGGEDAAGAAGAGGPREGTPVAGSRAATWVRTVRAPGQRRV